MRYGKEDLNGAPCGYTESLDRIIVALCCDFDRRVRAIENSLCTGRTAVEYKYFNYKMLEGAEEIVGPMYAATVIHEIGHRIGYARSKVDGMGENMYKMRKLEVKINMARKLHLLD